MLIETKNPHSTEIPSYNYQRSPSMSSSRVESVRVDLNASRFGRVPGGLESERRRSASPDSRKEKFLGEYLNASRFSGGDLEPGGIPCSIPERTRMAFPPDMPVSRSMSGMGVVPNQDALQRLHNHSIAASAFTPTTPTIRRDTALKYPPHPAPGFMYGDLPSYSPVKPSSLQHQLPPMPTGTTASFGGILPHAAISFPRHLLPYSGYPLGMLPAGALSPGPGAAAYPPFLHMLSAASHLLPFGAFPSKKMFRCSECRYMTDRKNNLKRHMSTMHGDCEKVLECCEITFKSKASLREHVLLFHQSGYRCRHCGRNFCRKALLKRHLAVHNGAKEYCCETCDYATSHKSNLERHRKVHDNDGSSPMSDDEQGEYLPEPEELLGNQSGNDVTTQETEATKPDRQAMCAREETDSFEENSDDEEEIEVSDEGVQSVTAAIEKGNSVVVAANSNNIISERELDNANRYVLTPMGKQSAFFDAPKKVPQCQDSAFSPVPDYSYVCKAENKHSSPNEKAERTFKMTNVFEEQRPSGFGTNGRFVCSRCFVEFSNEPEFMRHEEICFGPATIATCPKQGSSKEVGVKKSRKRQCFTRERETDPQPQEAIDNNEHHHRLNRWVFPTATARAPAATEIATPSAQISSHNTMSSPQYEPRGERRMSVITPSSNTLSHPQGTPAQGNRGGFRDHPATYTSLPCDSVHNPLRDMSCGFLTDDSENKQCRLPIRKPAAEESSQQRHRSLRTEPPRDQRGPATELEQMINGGCIVVDSSQMPQSASSSSDDDELDDKAPLPLKKRCIVVAGVSK